MAEEDSQQIKGSVADVVESLVVAVDPGTEDGVDEQDPQHVSPVLTFCSDLWNQLFPAALLNFDGSSSLFLLSC